MTVLVASGVWAVEHAKVWLDELPLDDMTSGWREPRKNKSVEENPIQIGAKTFARGVGTHAESQVIYRVDGKAVSFDADVGIDAKNLRDMADALIKTGLADHGWSYVNVDDFWQNNPYRGKKDPTLDGPERTADGTIVPNSRFPDMKGLADYIHSLGLRAGLYSSPGPHTCGGRARRSGRSR